MSNHAIEEAYKALKNGEPQTPNEIAEVIGMNQKTVQMALMELVSTKPDVKWKKIGRYRLFWKEKPK
jgi:predicted transcriptional regulator